MKRIKEIYYHIEGTDKADDRTTFGCSTSENYVKAEVYYDEGGYSMFTGNMHPRAYYISAHTVGRGKDGAGYWESNSILNPRGAKEMICEVSRQSKKKTEEAEQYFDENIERFLSQVYPDLKLVKEIA